MKKFILSTVSALMALTAFSQYFSKAFFTTNTDYLYTSQVLTNSKSDIFFTHYNNCDSVNICVGLSKINEEIKPDILKSILNKNVHKNTMKIRNDTIFYSYFDENLENNKYHWYYGMIDKAGNEVVNNKYVMPTPYEPFTYLYGLQLVNDNEVILWGNGYDPKVPYKKEEIKIVWMRLKLDGSLVSGPNYYKPPQLPNWAIATDAITDIDGNFVYISEYEAIQMPVYIYLFKINSLDQVAQIANIKAKERNDDYPQLTIDKDGNYYTTIFDSRSNEKVLDPPPILTKIDRVGNIIWQSQFDVTYSNVLSYEKTNQNFFLLNDLKTTKNGDILMVGANTVYDSVFIKKLNKKVIVSGWSGSFIARFNNEGKLLWRHFLIATKDNGLERVVSISDINEAMDGSIVIGGSIGAKDTTSFKYDPWVMRVGANGCFDDNCSHVNRWWFFPDEISTNVKDLEFYEKLMLYPNPCNEIININLPDNVTFPIQYQISGADGKIFEVGFQYEMNFKLDVTNVPSSIYYVLCKDKSGRVFYNNFLKN